MHSKALKRAMLGTIGAAAMLLAGAAQSAGVPGQGTWDTTLLGRDINGDAVAASGSSAVFLYDTTLDVTWLRDANVKGLLDWKAANTWVDALAVGVVLGPSAIHLASDASGFGHLAEFGIVFLMFVIGLEFNLPKLRSMKKLVFGLGLSQLRPNNPPRHPVII